MKSFKFHLLAAACIAASLSSPAWAVTDLSFGQTAGGTIAAAAQTDSYTFSAGVNDVVIFTATATSGTLSPLIRLYDPSSTLVGTVPSGSCTSLAAAEMSPQVLSASGVYTVVVSDCSATHTGGYNLYAQRTNNPSGAANLAFGSTPKSLINLAAQSDSYTFSATAGDVVDLTMAATSGSMNPKIHLYNPDGSLNDWAEAGGVTCTASAVGLNMVSLPATGTYTVLAGDCGDTNTGNYALYAQRTNNPTGATPVLWSQTQAGYIGSAAQIATYAFAGTSGNVVNLTVTETSGSLRPNIQLYNPDGTMLSHAPSASCTGAASAELTSVTLAQNGDYTVLVSDCAASSTGEYDLSSSCSGTCPVTPVIAWAAPAAILYGTALSAAQLDATASVSGGAAAGSVAYSPGPGAVLTGGLQTLSATFTPSDTSTYTTATATVQLTVNRATPALTWTAPADILNGVALSAAQLDARASVPGTFFYTPGPGALLPGGIQTLSVIFTPTERTDYTTATTTTQLGVDQPAEFTSPAPGGTLSGSSANFVWSAGTGVTAYIFHLGSKGVGSDDLYISGVTAATSANLTGLPVNGVMLYARLYSKIDGAWVYSDSTYTEAGTAAPAALISPAPGSMLSGSSAKFVWSPGAGVAGYVFHLGSKGVGGTDLYSSGFTTATSAVVTSLPVGGATLYARLYSEINGIWQSTDYTYTEAGTPSPAALESPTPGSRLSGSTTNFIWSAGSGVTAYVFHLGSKGVGSDDLYISGVTAATSASVSGVPAKGVLVYARLYSEINGAWQYTDYTYTEAGASAPAALNLPTPGTALSGSSANFVWSAGSGVTGYVFHLGSKGVGSSDLWSTGVTTSLSASVTVPTNGVTLYARLYSQLNGAWQYTDYTYTEAGTFAPAVLTSPMPGTTLSGSSVTFSWSAGTGVTAYVFHLSSKGVGGTDLASTGVTTALSATVNNLPVNGKTVYARLYSEIDGAWQYTDYTYTAQ